MLNLDELREGGREDAAKRWRDFRGDDPMDRFDRHELDSFRERSEEREDNLTCMKNQQTSIEEMEQS